MIGPCPDRDWLERMLADDLPPEDYATLELHLSACPPCLEALEALTEAPPPVPGQTLPFSPDFHRRLLARPPMLPAHELSTTADGIVRAAGPSFRPEVAGYEILGELGRGGMGVVYRALEVRLHRVVALKMVPMGAQAPAELLARFLTEAETVARVQHPNVVRIHAIGEHDARPYFEMEYVEGGSLASRLDGTPRHPREAARIVEAAARGVEAIHRVGVVHRDLKPSNILLGLDGEPKIGDFGLAKDLASDSGLTRTDVVLGSPSYMSPEQAEGHSTRVGPSADVYSLGAVLYELLTGRPPFRGASVLETLQQVRSTDPVPPSRLVPGVDRDAETIALKCLEKAPARRYASAGELADDLRRFLDRRPILARRVGPVGRLGRFCRRNPGIAGLASAVLLLLGLVAGVSLVAAIRIAVAAEAERRGRYCARMNLAQLAYEAADLGRMRELLAPYAPGGVDADLRGFEWNYWSRLARRFDAELVGHAGMVLAVAFSPDSKSVVSADDRATVLVWDRATGAIRSTLRLPHTPTTLAISPSGSTIVAGADNGSILIWGPGDRDPWVSPGPTVGPVAALRFVDESTLVAAHDPNIARTWDVGSRRLLSESRGPKIGEGPIEDYHPRPHALSSDGKRLAVADRVGGVEVRPLDAPRAGAPPVRAIRVGDLPARSLAFSGDGRTLAVGGEDHRITLVDLESDRLPIVSQGHGASLWAMEFSPDGKTLAAASFDNTASLWDVASGRQLAALKGHGGPILAIAYAPDGQAIATGGADKTVKLWRVDGDDLEVFSDGGRIGLDAIAFNREGSALAAGSRDGRITLWSTATRRPIVSTRPRSEANPDAHPGYIKALAFSPDGRILYSAGLGGPPRLWDARSLEHLGTLQAAPDDRQGYESMALSPGGEILAVGREDGEIALWDARDRRRISATAADRSSIRSLAFSPDGKSLASASIRQGLQIWDIPTMKRAARLGEDDWSVQSVAFAPDGRTLVAGDRQGKLTFWDPTGRSPVATQSAHSNSLTSLAFTPDGRSLFSGGRDDVIRVWDPATRELKSTFKGHGGNVLALDVSRDGRALASASLDGTARIWRGSEKPDQFAELPEIRPGSPRQSRPAPAQQDGLRREHRSASPGPPARSSPGAGGVIRLVGFRPEYGGP